VDRLLEIVAMFAPLSMVAIGGVNGTLPDIHRQVVFVHAWMTDPQFTDAYTLAQMVPGPNILVVSLIGWQAAGLPGAAVALVAMCGPSSLLALAVAKSLTHARVALWRQRLQAGLAPLSIGLMAASGLVLARGADQSWIGLGVTLLTIAILLRNPIHPLLLMGAGAVLGLLGLV
jgi:chromate transporter